MAEPPRTSDERRAALLAAAMAVFGRYGYRKASMDDIARAAGLSRQGLYLHFPTKETLFRAGLQALLDSSLAAAELALAGKRPLAERLVAAFDAMHGHHIDSLSRTHLAELIEASTRLVGDAVAQQERGFHERLVAALLRARTASDRAAAVALADTLDAVSHGVKQRATSRADYLERMRTAVDLLCRTR